MVFNYNEVEIHFEIIGAKEDCPCLLLHGWGCDGAIFDSFRERFPNRQFIVVDFPPFGKSQKEIVGWNIFTYASMVMSLCEHLHLSQFDILGHSFGGRVAIIISAFRKNLVRSLILADSAGMKPRRGLKYYFKLLKYKLLRKLGFFVKDAGSRDYQALPQNLKKTFVEVVNQHLEEYCVEICAKTLIIYGKKDKETPIYMAKRLKRLIKDSKLSVLSQAGHFPFLDSPLVFHREISRFWEGL